MMHYKTRIQQKLTAAFSPEKLEIIDDSHKHQGHSGAHAEGETHFNVTIVAAAFNEKSRVERQRMIYEVLSAEMEERVHALQVRILTPKEYAKQT